MTLNWEYIADIETAWPLLLRQLSDTLDTLLFSNTNVRFPVETPNYRFEIYLGGLQGLKIIKKEGAAEILILWDGTRLYQTQETRVVAKLSMQRFRGEVFRVNLIQLPEKFWSERSHFHCEEFEPIAVTPEVAHAFVGALARMADELKTELARPERVAEETQRRQASLLDLIRTL